jgi:hypothetical protein
MVALLLELGNSGSGEIADRLGSVLISVRGNDAIERRHELVVDGDGDPLHRRPSLPSSL